MTDIKDTEEERLDPQLADAALQGPAPEGAYDDDVGFQDGDEFVSMNSLMKGWNERMKRVREKRK